MGRPSCVLDKEIAFASEQELQPELHVPGRICRRDLTEQRTCDITGRVRVIDTIQRVERFPAELQVLRLCHPELLRQRRIELQKAGPLQNPQ